MSEVVNESAKLVAKSLEVLRTINGHNDTDVDALSEVNSLLEDALNKLTAKI